MGAACSTGRSIPAKGGVSRASECCRQLPARLTARRPLRDMPKCPASWIGKCAVVRRAVAQGCSLLNKSIALRFGAFEKPRGAASGLFFCKSMSPYHTPTIAGQTFGGIDNPKIVPDVFARNACRLEVPVAPRTLCSRPRGRCRYGWDVRPTDVSPCPGQQGIDGNSRPVLHGDLGRSHGWVILSGSAQNRPTILLPPQPASCLGKILPATPDHVDTDVDTAPIAAD